MICLIIGLAIWFTCGWIGGFLFCKNRKEEYDLGEQLVNSSLGIISFFFGILLVINFEGFLKWVDDNITIDFSNKK
ncbi:MAG: hypothetical protein WCW65_02655 [Candidatus Paceibacterota bacterium]